MLARRMPGWKLAKAKELRKRATPAEKLLLSPLRLYMPCRVRFQAPMLGYIVDFYIPQAKLIVEVDGASHEDQRAYDRHRDAAFASHGIHTLRFTNGEVNKSLATVCRTIHEVVNARIAERKARKPKASTRTRRPYTPRPSEGVKFSPSAPPQSSPAEPWQPRTGRCRP